MSCKKVTERTNEPVARVRMVCTCSRKNFARSSSESVFESVFESIFDSVFPPSNELTSGAFRFPFRFFGPLSEVEGTGKESNAVLSDLAGQNDRRFLVFCNFFQLFETANPQAGHRNVEQNQVRMQFFDLARDFNACVHGFHLTPLDFPTRNQFLRSKILRKA